MALFRFNIHDGQGGLCAGENIELAGLGEAYDVAIMDIRGMICDALASSGQVDLGGRIEVETDEAGHVLTVPFEEALKGSALLQ